MKSPENSFCALAKPIYFSKDDIITEETKREVLSHFETGEKYCSWTTAN